VSDSGKLEKPTQSQEHKRTAAPSAEAPASRGLRAGAGFQAVLDQRTRALEGVRYRATGGTSGTPPAGHIAAERRAIVGEAAARIMRQQSGSATGGQIPKTTGAPLPSDVRAKMEPKLGADLSSVKIHTGGESAKAATDFGARAFTVGSDVHFNSGEFAPGTKEGDKLLAHELTHVVQGQKSGIQRKASHDDEAGLDGSAEAGEKHEVSHPDEPAEKEADVVSEKVAGDLHGEKKEHNDKANGDSTNADNKESKEAGLGRDEAASTTKEAAPSIGAKLRSGIVINRAITVPNSVPSRPRPADGPNMQPIIGKLTQAITMFTAWAQRPADPSNTIAQQILRGLERCREQAQAIGEAQNRGLPDSQIRPLREQLANGLRAVQTLDPRYHLISVGEMSVTVTNARRQMNPVAVPPFTMLNPANRPEYERQLREQTDGMNAMVADQWRTNRDQYAATGRSAQGTRMHPRSDKGP
jgi:hypothetical protein